MSSINGSGGVNPNEGVQPTPPVTSSTSQSQVSLQTNRLGGQHIGSQKPADPEKVLSGKELKIPTTSPMKAVKQSSKAI